MLARTQPKAAEKPAYAAKPAPMSKEQKSEAVRKIMTRYRKTIAYLGR